MTTPILNPSYRETLYWSSTHVVRAQPGVNGRLSGSARNAVLTARDGKVASQRPMSRNKLNRVVASLHGLHAL